MKRKLWPFFIMIISGILAGIVFQKQTRISIPAASKVEKESFIIDVNQPMVAITYDDGPHPKVTNDILDVFQQYQAHATFFVIGDRVSHHQSVIQRIVETGCELGNHTYGHLDISGLNQDELIHQLKASEEVLASFVETGYFPKLVRPPFGNTSEFLLRNCPYPIITWSIDTRDWSHQNVSRSVKEITSHVQDGDIILMHDMYEATAEATKEIVPWLIEQGYQLVTVSEMFEAKGIELTAGKVYRHAH